MKNIFSIFFLSGLILCLPACKKNDNPGDSGIPSAPLKTQVGTPVGNAISKMIDGSGGTIISYDKNLVVVIPAGAVSAATNFTIQPVTNTIPNGIGTSYQLLPEGTHFSKPVNITFKYSDDSLRGSSTDYFHIGYQDLNGFWHVNKQTSVDVTQKTITAQSDHFSVWSTFVEIQLKQDKDIIHPTQSCNLQVAYVGTTDPNADDVEISAFDKFPNVEWNLDQGQGALVNTLGTTCTYTAPSAIPNPNPVTISAKFKNVKTIKLGTISQMILLANVEVKGDYFKIIVDKVPYEMDFLQCGESNTGFGIKTTIIAKSSASKFNLYLDVMSNSVGGTFFDASDSRPTTGVNITIGSNFYSSLYRDCNSAESHATVGNVELTSIGDVGKYVEGDLDGALLQYSSDICHNFILIEVHGKFSIIRSQ